MSFLMRKCRYADLPPYAAPRSAVIRAFELARVSHGGAGETCGLQGGCVTSLQSLRTQSAPHIGHRVLTACWSVYYGAVDFSQVPKAVH